MGTRWYSLTVVIFWLATMSWLLATKFAPPLRVGERPNMAKLAVESQAASRLPVAWKLFWDDRPIGWATSETRRTRDEVTQLRNEVHIARFPLRELAPMWFWRYLELGDEQGELTLDTESVVEFVDPGKLKGFQSTLHFGQIAEPIVLTGVVKSGTLEITFRLGDFSYTSATSQFSDALLGDSLSPKSRLPDLHVGQSWTEPIYSPFQPPTQPMQILQATVEREETIEWNGEVVNTRLIVYRNDSGAESSTANATRGRVWVRRDGTVLKQEVMLIGSRLLFLRMAPGQSAAPVAIPSDPSAGSVLNEEQP